MFANNKMRENSGRLIKIYRERMHQGSKDKRFSCNEFILATKDHPFYEIVEDVYKRQDLLIENLKEYKRTKRHDRDELFLADFIREMK